MSLILDYGGGGGSSSPPTADILYSPPTDTSINNTTCDGLYSTSTDPGVLNNTPCGSLPSPPTQSISSLSSSSSCCDGPGILSSSSSQASSALNTSSGYTSSFVSSDSSDHLPCSSSSSSTCWHHVRHDRGDLFLPPFPGGAVHQAVGGEEGGLYQLDSPIMEAGGAAGDGMIGLSSSSSSSSSLGNNHHRLACKASRRRRRSPPSVTKFDINDNSLHSVYTFIKSFLSASTASTVAIDNKIEQAMDLVKSHLMFAVREEVDVLKERIGELMERINHLEYENTVLRKYATQEALQQIQQQHGGAPNP